MKTVRFSQMKDGPRAGRLRVPLVGGGVEPRDIGCEARS